MPAYKSHKSHKSNKSSKHTIKNVSNSQTQVLLGHHSLKIDNKLPKQFENDDNGDGKYIPTFYIVNSPSAASVVIHLNKNQTVYDQKGALNYCDSAVKIETKTGGIMRGFMRALFTTESFFMTYYTGTLDERKTVVSFASHLIGDIIGVRIKSGEKMTLSSMSFVAATTNIELNVKTRFRNILGGDNIFISEASIVKSGPGSDCDGMIWLAAFGGIEHLTVPDGVSMKVDHGLFVVAKSEYNYKITSIGGLKSFMFGGEGFAMHFFGPCDIYIQSRNINHYLHFLDSRLKKSKSGGSIKAGGELLKLGFDLAK